MITHKFHKTKVKIIHFFSKTKIIDSKTKIHIKHLITHLIIFHQEDYCNQNHQQFFQEQRLHSYHVRQPDILEPYKQEQPMRQPRSNAASQNNDYNSQNPVNTDSYQTTQ